MRPATPRRPGRALVVVAIVAAVSLAGALIWGLARSGSDDDAAPATTSSTATTSSASGTDETSLPPDGATGEPVPVPEDGAYLGAFLNTHDVNGGGSMKVVLDNLPEFTDQIGRNPAIIAAYQPWAGPWVKDDNLKIVSEEYGAVPMLSWSCGVSNEEIVSGAQDDVIQRQAEKLKAYGGPVLLRWFWEPNLMFPEDCLGPGTAPERTARYIEAFRHIAHVFDEVGADNVAFVWAPSTATVAALMEPFYPGDDVVDWIGVDGYGESDIASVVNGWYDQFASHGKPMIVAETGATDDQADYLADIGRTLPVRYPEIKAVVYFDAVGTFTDWRLTSYGGAGIDAYAALGRDPYFSKMPTG